MDLFHVGGLISTVAILLWALARCALWPGKRSQLPPGPFPLPIVGSLLHVFSSVPHRSLAKLSERYGPIVFLRLGSMPTVVVSSPEIAREFLQTHDKVFASRPAFESANRLSYGQDMAVATTRYGADWRELRKLYSLQLFTAKRIRQFQPIVADEIKRTLQGLHSYAQSGTPLDVTAFTGQLLGNIICRILVGKGLSDVSDARLGSNLKQILHHGTVLFQIPVIGDLIPYLGFLDRKAKRSMDEWHACVDLLLESLLASREKLPATNAPKDFLDVLLANNLPRDKIKSIILELLSAGMDTSSVTVEWAMAELLTHPHVLKKLEEEVESVVGSERMVEEGDLPKLIYTKAVVKETMRMHPPLPLLIPHMSTQACTVAGYNLEEGTRLIANVWAIGRDPQTWNEPDRFMPERFLEKCEDLDVRGKHFELLPFGAGRRSCPGMPLALPIVEMTLSNLIHKVQWVLPPNQTVDMSEKFGIVVNRGSPLMAIPSLRG